MTGSSAHPGAVPARLTAVTSRLAGAPRILGSALVVLALGGCGGFGSFTGAKTVEPYQPADGVAASMGTVLLRDVAVVTDAKGSPGVLTGAAINRGDSAATVAAKVDGDAGTAGSVSVPAGGATPLSGITVAAVPSAPGAWVDLVVTTPNGDTLVSVPVLSRVGAYSTLTPSVAP